MSISVIQYSQMIIIELCWDSAASNKRLKRKTYFSTGLHTKNEYTAAWFYLTQMLKPKPNSEPTRSLGTDVKVSAVPGPISMKERPSVIKTWRSFWIALMLYLVSLIMLQLRGNAAPGIGHKGIKWQKIRFWYFFKIPFISFKSSPGINSMSFHQKATFESRK